ncbi:MAG TPA: hypothetical protein VER33_28335 [Polyangiaceae bacterium]|nr:hypothetical protein [Polyangiaceae bacterium]
MLILLGPDFAGTNEAYERLASATGLSAYDLRARLRPGTWGVVKALADAAQAEALVSQLGLAGFAAKLVDSAVANDSDRRIVAAVAITLRDEGFVVQLRDRAVDVAYSAVACVVRGEVQPGRSVEGVPSSSVSTTFRTPVPGAEPGVGHDTSALSVEAYQAADLHFFTVSWVARLDARALDLVASELRVAALDALVEELAQRARVRVDRSARTSSLASFAQTLPRRASVEPPSGRDVRREQPDLRFDSYSRLVGEAERRARLT